MFIKNLICNPLLCNWAENRRTFIDLLSDLICFELRGQIDPKVEQIKLISCLSSGYNFNLINLSDQLKVVLLGWSKKKFPKVFAELLASQTVEPTHNRRPPWTWLLPSHAHKSSRLSSVVRIVFYSKTKTNLESRFHNCSITCKKSERKCAGSRNLLMT